MRRSVLAVIGALLALPAGAHAQTSVGFFAVPGEATHVKTKNLVVRVTGQVSVSFHADPATGCAALAACAYSGTVTWVPNGGSLTLVQYKQRRRTHQGAFLAFGDSGPGSLTASVVRRAGGGQCADEQPGVPLLISAERGANQTFTLKDALQPTRCAGPLPGDLAGVVPRVTVSSHRLEAGHLRLDFHGRRSFAASGFAGTLTSTLVVRVGGPERSNPPPPDVTAQPPGPATKSVRVVTETLHLTRVIGELSDSVAGTSNSEVCVLLDACGLGGTLTLTPKPLAPRAALVATGAANRPYRDFLAALGLSRAGHAAGISVSGQILWSQTGTVTEAVHQAAPCSDAVRLGDGFVALTLTRSRIAGDLEVVDPLRTRCPGPFSGVSGPLAHGSAPRARLRQPTLAITLRGSGNRGDEGYVLRPGGAITLELRRGRLHQSVERVPTLAF